MCHVILCGCDCVLPQCCVCVRVCVCGCVCVCVWWRLCVCVAVGSAAGKSAKTAECMLLMFCSVDRKSEWRSRKLWWLDAYLFGDRCWFLGCGLTFAGTASSSHVAQSMVSNTRPCLKRVSAAAEVSGERSVCKRSERFYWFVIFAASFGHTDYVSTVYVWSGLSSMGG